MKILSLNFKKYFSTKVLNSFDEAVEDIKSGNRLIFGGFGLCGIPENLMKALLKRNDLKNLEVVSDDGGVADFGLGLLLEKKMIKRMVGSYIGNNKLFEKQFFNGDLELELVPQGTLAEKMRCGGAGIPAFYTPTGIGTLIETGGMPLKYNKDSSIAIISKKKETIDFENKKYILERSLRGDFSLIKGWKGDTKGNIIFRKTARNFNIDAATAGKICIAEVEHLVEPGELNPDEIHLPGIYVKKILKGESYEKRIENFTTSDIKEIKDEVLKLIYFLGIFN
jgi:3-oxoacid CoA-transferase A subunit